MPVPPVDLSWVESPWGEMRMFWVGGDGSYICDR